MVLLTIEGVNKLRGGANDVDDITGTPVCLKL